MILWLFRSEVHSCVLLGVCSVQKYWWPIGKIQDTAYEYIHWFFTSLKKNSKDLTVQGLNAYMATNSSKWVASSLWDGQVLSHLPWATRRSLFLSIPCLALEASVSGLEHHLLIPQLHRRSSQSIVSFPRFTSPAGRAWRAQAECMDSTSSWGSLRLSCPARDSPWLEAQAEHQTSW